MGPPLPPSKPEKHASCRYAARGFEACLFHQRFADGFARFPNLGLAFARDDDRMGIRVMLPRDGAGDAGHPGSSDVDWPSAWQGKFFQRPCAATFSTTLARLPLT